MIEAHMEETDLVHLYRLLRLASERRKNEADSEQDREPDPPHRAPQVGIAGGSLAEGHERHQSSPTRYRVGLGPLVVSVSGAPPTPRRAAPAPSGSNARSSAIFSED